MSKHCVRTMSHCPNKLLNAIRTLSGGWASGGAPVKSTIASRNSAAWNSSAKRKGALWRDTRSVRKRESVEACEAKGPINEGRHGCVSGERIIAKHMSRHCFRMKWWRNMGVYGAWGKRSEPLPWPGAREMGPNKKKADSGGANEVSRFGPQATVLLFLIFYVHFLRHKYVHGFYLLYQAVKWLVKKTHNASSQKNSPDHLGSCFSCWHAVI